MAAEYLYVSGSAVTGIPVWRFSLYVLLLVLHFIYFLMIIRVKTIWDTNVTDFENGKNFLFVPYAALHFSHGSLLLR
jgi:hypothetical protein